MGLPPRTYEQGAVEGGVLLNQSTDRSKLFKRSLICLRRHTLPSYAGVVPGAVVPSYNTAHSLHPRSPRISAPATGTLPPCRPSHQSDAAQQSAHHGALPTPPALQTSSSASPQLSPRHLAHPPSMGRQGCRGLCAEEIGNRDAATEVRCEGKNVCFLSVNTSAMHTHTNITPPPPTPPHPHPKAYICRYARHQRPSV